MRNTAAAVLSIPVIAAIVVATAVRRSVVARIALVGAMVVLVGAGAFALAPREASARPPASTGPVVEARLSSTLLTDAPLSGAVTIDFSAAMDPSSVASALRVDPPAQVQLRWEQDGRRLVVTPAQPWQPSTYVTVTVDAGAKDLVGAALATPARASFVTRRPTGATVTATDVTGKRAAPDTAFAVTFDHPVDAAAVERAIKMTPATTGTVTAAATAGGTTVTFTPSAPLRPNTVYTFQLAGDLRDADGGSLATLPRLVVRTLGAPGVVRFRPAASVDAVSRDATLSVRFTERMDRVKTALAFRATTGGKMVAGKVSWAEGDTVLVFAPKKPLPYGAKVVLAVSTRAVSAAGVHVGRARTATFTVEPKPRPKPKPPATPRTQANATTKKPPVRSTAPAPAANAATEVGGGAWASIERYYLSLLNCTRTGGWVASNGGCSSPGSRDVIPLVYDPGIAAHVSRPYAKYLAERGACDHFLDGNPGTRLRRAGYTSYRWAENIGCPSGDPKRGAIATQLFFQSEKPYNGGHYVNLMNALYTRVGIGVWVHKGYVRIVSDFYDP